MIRLYWCVRSERDPEELLYLALEADLGRRADREDWQIRRADRGKPFFPRHRERQFSISDSGPIWACAFADQEIGLDLQFRAKRSGEDEAAEALRLEKLSRRFFSEAERDYVTEEPGEVAERFYEVWTAKEAYVKYTGRGIDEGFPAFSVVPGEKTILDEVWISTFELLPGCALSLCARDADLVRVEDWAMNRQGGAS